MNTAFYQPYWTNPYDEQELEHYGVLGMKWGIRRYQNKDGTLTAAGKKRYAGDTDEQIAKSEARKAKVIKGVKIAASVATIGVSTAMAVSSLMSGNVAGTVTMGSKAVSQLLGSGILSNRDAASLAIDHTKLNGTKSIDLSNWNVEGNPYYQPGTSQKEQELLATAIMWQLENQR